MKMRRIHPYKATDFLVELPHEVHNCFWGRGEYTHLERHMNTRAMKHASS